MTRVRVEGFWILMAGFVIDIVIVYFFKALVRLRRTWGSQSWPLVEAKVVSASMSGDTGYGCPSAKIRYTYELNGESFEGVDYKACFYSDQTELRVETFRPRKRIKIRVHPEKHDISVLHSADQ